MRPLLLSVAALSAVLLANVAHAQQQLWRNVDPREVIRRGDMVEHISNDVEYVDAGQLAIAQVAATPQNDLQKWFISVVGMKGCIPCKQLLDAWATDRTLLAYADPANPKQSWAHFSYYDKDDPLENWRWRGMRIAAYPTIIVQPPRNGKYGPPNTVVFQYVWEGDPELFHRKLNATMKAYLNSLEKRRAGQTATASTGIQSTVEPTGIGQQQVPPLDLPLEPRTPPEEERAPLHPFRDTISAMGRKPEIVVVRDKGQEYPHEAEASVNEYVRSLQPTGDRYVVRNVDASETNARYGVSPEETPVVLLVDGKHVMQKLSAKQVQNRESLGLLFMIVSSFLGTGAMVHVVVMVIKLMVAVVIGFVVIVVIVMLIGTLRNRPQPAPQIDAHTLAVLQAMLAQQKAADPAKV